MRGCCASLARTSWCVTTSGCVLRLGHRLTFEFWVSDLEVAVEASVERCCLDLAGSVDHRYAVRHPERVSHLVLHRLCARTTRAARQPPNATRPGDEYAAELGGGQANPVFRQYFTSQFIPGAARATTGSTSSGASDLPGERRQVHALFQRNRRDGAAARLRPTLVMHAVDGRASRSRKASSSPRASRARASFPWIAAITCRWSATPRFQGGRRSCAHSFRRSLARTRRWPSSRYASATCSS